jgi:predicted transcriptional regulator
MAKKSDTELSSAQLQIMNIVWEQGEVGVAEIWKALAQQRPVARNTVQTMVSRLQARGWLKHRQAGNAFFYTAALPRQRALGRMVSRLVDAAFGGSASGLVLTLLQDTKLSPDETQRIREMIDHAESRKQKPP